MLSGNVNDIGTMTHANDTMEKMKLNTISPLFFNHTINPQYKNAASKQIIKLIPIRLPVLSTLEKSTSVAK